jgi:UDP-N-acetyl-D-glucosamine dehydrogenase
MDFQIELTNKFQNHSARVVILGLGYVGLPLAVVFADAGYTVIGVDPIREKVDAIQQGKSYIADVPSEQVARLVKEGKLSATVDFSVIRDADAVSICVPTPLLKTGDPDLSFIVSARDSVAKYMHPGMVIILESSTYPGTTRELVLPKLVEASGLVVERISSWRSHRNEWTRGGRIGRL